MTTITRRRLLGAAAAVSVSVPLPVGAEGKSDIEILQMLFAAHRAAQEAYDNSPAEIWEDMFDEAKELGLALDRSADALCFYRPSTLEGVHIKAEMMIQAQFFADPENQGYFSQAELIGGFLPPGKAIEPWTDQEGA